MRDKLTTISLKSARRVCHFLGLHYEDSEQAPHILADRIYQYYHQQNGWEHQLPSATDARVQTQTAEVMDTAAGSSAGITENNPPAGLPYSFWLFVVGNDYILFSKYKEYIPFPHDHF